MAILHQRQCGGRGVHGRSRGADHELPSGDIGYVKRNNGHWVKNTGNTELQFLEVFKSPYFVDVSLSDWLTHTPREMVAATFNIDPAVIARWPNDKPETLPIYQG